MPYCEYLKRLYKRFIERNAYLRRNTLSDLRFPRVMYFCVHSPSESLVLRVLLVYPRFNDNRFRFIGRNANILCNILSDLRFALVTYFYVRSLRQIRALRVLPVSPLFNGSLFRQNGRNAYKSTLLLPHGFRAAKKAFGATLSAGKYYFSDSCGRFFSPFSDSGSAGGTSGFEETLRTTI